MGLFGERKRNLTQRQKTEKKANRQSRAKEYWGKVGQNLLSGENKKISLSEKKIKPQGTLTDAGHPAVALAQATQNEKLEDSAAKLFKVAGPTASTDIPLNRGGGIGPMDLGGDDNTDLSSNMTKAYMKKKGY